MLSDVRSVVRLTDAARERNVKLTVTVMRTVRAVRSVTRVVRVAFTGVSRLVNALASPFAELKESLLSGMLFSVVVPAVKSAGFRCLSYTVNDEWAAQRLLNLGIDGLITDRVDLFSPAA